MKNRIMQLARWIALGVLALLLVAAFGPFLFPIRPLENVTPVAEAATADSQFVTIPFAGTDGIDIHYLTTQVPAETEQVYILMHGSVFNAFTWNQVIDFFGKHGRVIAYDQIPYGLSEKLVPGSWTGPNPYSTEAAVTQLIALLDTLEVDKAILVGNSYGGVLAVQAALDYPERIDALILTDAAVYVDESMPAWILESPQMRRLGPLFARMIGNNESFVRQTYLNPAAIDAERLRLTLIHTEVEDWDTAMWAYLQVWGSDPVDVTGQLGDVQQPTLVISGDSDTIVPPADSELLATQLPDATFASIPACGHVPQEECPAQFENTVASWLDQLNR